MFELIFIFGGEQFYRYYTANTEKKARAKFIKEKTPYDKIVSIEYCDFN